MTFVLGLTGSMATGKSTVLNLFAEKNVPTLSADGIVHALYAGEAVGPIEAAFSNVTKGGGIDRGKLAERVAQHPKNLAKLEKIVHPLVRGKILDFIKMCRNEKKPLAVIEIPLLYESANFYPLDAVAVTWCDPELQARRALARTGMNVEKFHSLLARQLPQDEKKARADFLIDTGCPIQQTRRRVGEIITRLMESAHEA